jgi:hypothetical protein
MPIINKSDWIELKDLYIMGELDKEGKVVYSSNVDLAKRFGISPQALSVRIKDEDWKTEKNLYLDNVEKRKREKRIESLASEAADFDVRLLNVAKDGITTIEHYFKLAKDKIEKDKKAMSLDSLELLARSAEKFQKIARLALGENTSSVQSNIESWLDLFDVIEED